MKKKILCFALILFLILCIYQIRIFAASVPLGTVTVNVTDTKIEPGQEVTVNIDFGTTLGAYTFDVAYDNNIFEYVRSEGGTENDNGTRVRVTYYDSTGGTNPRSNMSVTFKAKENIVSTNPTDFSITAEGLANADASQTYDDITTPIKKSVTVEPNYVDYTIEFNQTGTILVDEANDMELITRSTMGKNYDHVKMTVEVTKKPSDNANVTLLATTRTRQEVDLIRDGWGEPDGYQLGGKNVEQILDVRGTFSEIGDYTIKVSLLDMDSSNAVIQEKEFNFSVKNEEIVNEGEETVPPTENENENQNNNEGNVEGTTNNGENTTQEELPESLPKTGTTQYAYIIAVISILAAAYITLQNQKINKK